MTDPTTDQGALDSAGPSSLDLVRLSPRLLFPPGGVALYRQVALLADLTVGDEVLVVGSGNGVTLEYFVTEYGVQGSGVDFDAAMVDASVERARASGLADRMQLQQAPMDRLPYRDGIFDVGVGELGLTAHADPKAAVQELVRVIRPGGTLVLLQLVWKAPVDKARRQVLVSHLGVRPMMLVEWKRLLREAGLDHLHTEDWSDEETAFRPRVAKPFPDFAELFSWTEKIGIFRRAWRRWGWAGVKAAITREREVHRLLTRERILGLDLIKGVKRVGGSEPASARVVPPEVSEGSLPEADDGAPTADHTGEHVATEDVEDIALLAPDQNAETEAPDPEPEPEPESDGPDSQSGEGLPKTSGAQQPEGSTETEGLPLFGGPDVDE